jgi:hypothetical protein
MKKTYKMFSGARCLALLSIAACLLGSPTAVRAQVPAAAQKAPEAIATPTGRPGRIQFYGQSPANTAYGHVDPIDACPNVVTVDPWSSDGVIGSVNSQPYRFEFDTECLGNYYNLGRPPFIWTIKYLTESGRVYQERIGDNTTNGYSRMKIYFYDRVPTPGVTPTNLTATTNGGNPNVSLSPVTAAANTAQPGEPIYGIRLECTGYSCKITDDADGIDIRYYGRRPNPIAIANAPAQLCRNVTYALSVGSVFDASNYLWSVSNGGSIAASGTSATLNLANVSPNATSVTVSVVAQNAAGNCGSNYSLAQTLTLPLAPSATAPQRLALSNGLCPTSGGNTKTATVAFSAPGTVYSWTVTGAGATIVGASQGTDLTAISLMTPQAGAVTISVRAKTSDCGGYSPALTQTFQIGNVVTVAPTGVTKVGGYCSDAYWCFDHANSIVVDNPQPGLLYRMFISDVVPAETNPDPFYRTKIFQAGDGAPAGDIYLSGSQVRSFRLTVTTENPCPAPGNPASSLYSTVFNIVPVNGDAQRTSSPGGTSGTGKDKAMSLAHSSVLYPNPTTGKVNIAPQVEGRYEWVKVLDGQGRLVSEQHASNPAGVTSFDLKALPAGLYQVQLFNGQELVQERLVKE